MMGRLIVIAILYCGLENCVTLNTIIFLQNQVNGSDFSYISPYIAKMGK